VYRDPPAQDPDESSRSWITMLTTDANTVATDVIGGGISAGIGYLAERLHGDLSDKPRAGANPPSADKSE
jgi:hypothetical protein